jgi:hypothetical protein
MEYQNIGKSFLIGLAIFLWLHRIEIFKTALDKNSSSFPNI